MHHADARQAPPLVREMATLMQEASVGVGALRVRLSVKARGIRIDGVDIRGHG